MVDGEGTASAKALKQDHAWPFQGGAGGWCGPGA